MAKKKNTGIDSPERKFIDGAMKRLKMCTDAEDHNRKAAIEDLNFTFGDQWDPSEKKRRASKGRPCLVINHLPKYVDQIVGDMLHNTPAIKISPVDNGADIHIARVRQGIITNIEYTSDAESIYNYGAKQQVASGYGAWRVLTRYTDDNPFLQEAYLEGIRNPFTVYLDPRAKDHNYADAEFGFILHKYSKEDFESEFPKATPPGDTIKIGTGLSKENWWDKETITVAEYFHIEKEEIDMVQLKDGRILEKSEFNKIIKEWEEKNQEIIKQIQFIDINKVGDTNGQVLPQAPQGQPPIGANIPTQGLQTPQGQLPVGANAPTQGAPAIPEQSPMDMAKSLEEKPTIARERKHSKRVIRHHKLTCIEILEGGLEGDRFPGKYIPIVLIKGKELNIEGKNHVFSAIRHGKDVQKMINYWNTSAAETVALAPKNPWLVTPKQVEGLENDYAEANIENNPFLLYNPDPDAPNAMPQRQGPPAPPVGILEQINRGEENLKAVLGLFNADIGAPDSRQTGAAVREGQRPGDIGSYEFASNLIKGVIYTGKILNEIIPEIYDSERDVRVRNDDSSEAFVPINTTLENAYKLKRNKPDMYFGLDEDRIKSLIRSNGIGAKFNDITVGRYDVTVSTGPNYATQRAEAADHLLRLFQAAPQQMGTALDLIVRNMNIKDSDELETRLRKPLIAQGIVKPRPGEQVGPPPPNPQLMLLQGKLQIEQSKQQIAQMKVQQEGIKLEHEKIKMQLEVIKAQAELATLGGDNSEGLEEKRHELQLKQEQLMLEIRRLEHQINKDNHSMYMDEEKHHHQKKCR